MTEAEKKELEVLKAKASLNDEEKARKAELDTKAAGGGEKTFSEDYVKSLRAEAAKYRTSAKEKEEALAKLEGIDPEEYAALKAEKEKAEEKKQIDAGEFDKIKQGIIAAHKAELEKEKGVTAAALAQNKVLEGELHKTILANEIAIAATVAQAINPELVELVVMQVAKVETLENGMRVPRILDGEGKPRLNLKTGEPLKVDELLEEMKQSQKYAHLFSGGKVGAGSGSLMFDGKSIPNPWKKESFNLSTQGKITMESPDLAARLKAEAGK